jgi:hypothetical protein
MFNWTEDKARYCLHSQDKEGKEVNIPAKNTHVPFNHFVCVMLLCMSRLNWKELNFQFECKVGAVYAHNKERI